MGMTIDGTAGLTFPNGSGQNVGGVGSGGQTWQNMTASRAGGTNYTNDTGKPIMVAVSFASTGAGFGGNFVINGVALPQTGAATNNGSYAYQSVIVPAGAVYSFFLNGAVLSGNNGIYWSELR